MLASTSPKLELPLQTHHDFQQNYQFLELLGTGRTGFVCRGRRNSDNKLVAIKVIQKQSMVVDKFKFCREIGKSIPMECFILKRLNHPNIIQFVDYGEDDFNFYIVTEFHGAEIQCLEFSNEFSNTPSNSIDSISSIEAQMVPTGSPRSFDLFEYVDNCPSLDEASIIHIFLQLLKAVDYLHESSICHRDIKDENICIDADLNCKLIDFGSAERVTTLNQFKTFRGTLLYTPPELLNLNVRHNGPEVDVWCLGIVLYVLSYNGLPFNTITDIKLQRYSPVMTTRSPELSDLISKMLDPNPSTRATTRQLFKHILLQ